jgi:acetoacetyl-CoA synthetase
VVDEVGELVVTCRFPSAPLFFWGDEHDARYRDSYFSYFPGTWRHGDLAKINARGGAYIYGRSDATLDRFGVRIGTAEVYGVMERIAGILDSLVVCCETPGGGFYMPLFVALKPGVEMTAALRAQIQHKLREEASPRHVPDEIHQAPGIPYTLTGKKMEVPVRKLLMGAPLEKVVSRDAVLAPELLDWYVAFANRSEIRARRETPAA